MLATLTDERFSDPDWIYERKLDGERALAFRNNGRVDLLSRNRSDLRAAYPELVEALAALPPADFIVDGEIVAFEGKRTSFSRLQRRMHASDPQEARASGVAVFYYLFDVLHLRGRNITRLGLRDRKQLLRHGLDFADPLRLLPYRNEDGERYLERACAREWEGLIAKRATSEYQHSRSRDWLKFKCVNGQELVIGGYTDPQGARARFGALLVGYYRGDELVYAGKVGTGFDDDTLNSLGEKLASRERKAAPFTAPEEISSRGVHWVRPNLVAQFEFTEWTAAGKLRHPRYVGLRHDKGAHEVTRERPR